MSINWDKLKKARVENIRSVIEKLDLDAIVACNTENVRYITDQRPLVVVGWEPNSIAILPKDGDLTYLQINDFAIPGPLWADKGKQLAQKYIWNHYPMYVTTILSDQYVGWMRKALDKIGLKKGRIGLDRAPWQWYEEMKSQLPDFKIINAEEEILLARAIKSEEEVKAMKRAAKVASIGVNAGLDALKEGAREYEVYGAFAKAMCESGSEGDSFWPFLSTGPISIEGPLSAQGTCYPVNRKLQKGDPCLMDMGPVMDGYCGDCMRTGYVGKPTKEFKDLYNVVYDAMYAGIKAIKPGVLTSVADAAVRKVFAEQGYNGICVDSGHGMGMAAAELPVMMKKEFYTKADQRDLKFKPNMIITCEPKTYKMISKNQYVQVGLEETILVTDTGYEVITDARFIDELIE